MLLAVGGEGAERVWRCAGFGREPLDFGAGEAGETALLIALDDQRGELRGEAVARDDDLAGGIRALDQHPRRGDAILGQGKIEARRDAAHERNKRGLVLVHAREAVAGQPDRREMARGGGPERCDLVRPFGIRRRVEAERRHRRPP